VKRLLLTDSIAPLVSAIDYFQNVIGLNDTFMASIRTRAQFCGYLDFFDKFTTAFPPSGILPPAPSHERDGCDLFADVYDALYYVNPCFNIYHVTDYCPYLWNELGFPGLGGGPSNYFNRSDVQKVIHAPPTDYFLCGGGDNLFPDDDKSVRSALGPLPSVIERTNNTIIGHGMLDFLLFANGSIISIQNMTWNGLQGFQANPLAKDKNFYVPYHQSLGEIIDAVNAIDPEGDPFFDTAGAGLQGTWHTERGLTFVTYSLAGHAVPQYVPGAAYRTLEVLLGRVENLGVVGDFSTQTGKFTGGFSAYEVR
jgi:carboxypeptidase D